MVSQPPPPHNFSIFPLISSPPSSPSFSPSSLFSPPFSSPLPFFPPSLSLSLYHRHLIRSGIWNTRTLAIDRSNTQSVARSRDMTIQMAIRRWYEDRNSTFEFRDACVGPYCNDQCPEIFTLGELTSNNWPIWGKSLIAGVVVVIVVCMLLTKISFVIWLFCLERKQNAYLEQLDGNIESSQSSLNLEVSPSISISFCLYKVL